jgi:hypothetical protein
VSCRRFEEEGLLRLEQGLPLDEHFATCEDCVRARAEYERLGRALRDGALDAEPPADWKDRVRGRIAAEEAAPQRPSRIMLAAAAVAAIGFAVLIWRTTSGVEPGELEVGVLTRAVVSRGAGVAAPGDVLSLAATGAARNVELRVYFNDEEVVLRCSDEAPCQRRNGSVTAELAMDRRGRYQPVLVVSRRVIPPPRAGLRRRLRRGARGRRSRHSRRGDRGPLTVHCTAPVLRPLDRGEATALRSTRWRRSMTST